MSHIPATSNYSAAVNPAPGVSLCYLASHLPIFRHQLLKISLGLVLDAFNHIQLKVDYRPQPAVSLRHGLDVDDAQLPVEPGVKIDCDCGAEFGTPGTLGGQKHLCMQNAHRFTSPLPLLAPPSDRIMACLRRSQIG
jgi:hypothetical protein